jgi:hypothetical protein
MLMEIFTAFACPVMAGCAGYNLNGQMSGAFAGFIAYTAFILVSGLLLRYQRRDYWASKLAMLKAEMSALNAALASAGTLAETNQVIQDAYRARLALLQVSMTAVQAGYASEKEAGWLGHGSARRSGLVDPSR